MLNSGMQPTQLYNTEHSSQEEFTHTAFCFLKFLLLLLLYNADMSPYSDSVQLKKITLIHSHTHTHTLTRAGQAVAQGPGKNGGPKLIKTYE